jgi:prophage regulatory protein
MGRFLRLKQVIEKTGLSRPQIYRLGEFPRQVALSEHGRSVAWAEDEIVHWQQRRLNAARHVSTAEGAGAR